MLAWPWDAQNLCPEVNPWGCLESSLGGFFPMLFWNHFPMICEETSRLKTSSLSMILWGSRISSCLLLTVMPKLWGFPWRTVEMCPIFDKIPYILNLMSEQLHHLLAPTETSSFLRVLSLPEIHSMILFLLLLFPTLFGLGCLLSMVLSSLSKLILPPL